MNELIFGANLPAMQKVISQEVINRYAEASRDHNPIHIDVDFARKTPLGGTIAHGMLILAYVSQMMTEAFGYSWLAGGNLGVRFKSPARPGDTVNISGKISKVERHEERTVVNCEVLCSNQKGEVIIIGDATVAIKIDK
jgi:acyl dehydratase